MFSAQEKFWKSQDLVEQLVPFLGARSASNLTQVHPLTIKVLESAPVWSKLVRRTCQYNNKKPDRAWKHTLSFSKGLRYSTLQRFCKR